MRVLGCVGRKGEGRGVFAAQPFPGHDREELEAPAGRGSIKKLCAHSVF